MATVYHASPYTNLQVIDPQYSVEQKVFAAGRLDMAYAFLEEPAAAMSWVNDG